MGLINSDVLCPYCLAKLKNKDLKMSCQLCGSETEGTWANQFLKKSPKCKEPGCRGFATDRKCGFCESKLPSDLLDYEKYLRFSILGISGCGKSNFLTTMLHELRHTLGSPWIIAPMDTLTASIFQENDQEIYEDRRPVKATPAGMTPPPQLWRIKDKNRMTNKTIPSYSMTIFDGAGEDCVHINPVISRYIEGSKVLVILIDPLALPGVARTISSDILKWSTTAKHDADASANMVDGLANYIRQSCNIPAGKLINKEVAVVFTKIDAVKESFGYASMVMQPSPHLGQKAFVEADSLAVDEEIRDWLISRGESTFIDAIETNFRRDKIRFFGVSSFGQPPTGDSQLGKVMPHRVLDPLIWMLSKEGIVPTVK